MTLDDVAPFGLVERRDTRELDSGGRTYHHGSVRRWGIVGLAMVGLSACGEPLRYDTQVQLSYEEAWLGEGSRGPWQVGDPIAVGALAALRVENHERLPEYAVTSSDPSVLALEVSHPARPDLVLAWARSEGNARLTFAHEDEHLGELDLLVRAVDRVAVRAPPVRSERLLVMEGGDVLLPVDAYDAGGRLLFGVGAVRYGTRGGLSVVSALDRLRTIALRHDDFWVEREHVVVTADAVGPGSLEAESGDARHEVPFEVVDDTAVASVMLSRPWDLFAAWSNCLEVRAMSETGEEILSPACEWVVADDSRLRQSRLRSRICFERVDDDYDPISFYVTCRVGDVEGRTWIDVPPRS